VKVNWSKAAIIDLGLVTAFYEVRNPFAVKQLAADLRYCASTLEQFPEAGRAGELDNCRLLQVPGRPHLLPYRNDFNEIEILAVFDERRQRPDAWQ
jgi:plasmid stabilization system protein ParE